MKYSNLFDMIGLFGFFFNPIQWKDAKSDAPDIQSRQVTYRPQDCQIATATTSNAKIPKRGDQLGFRRSAGAGALVLTGSLPIDSIYSITSYNKPILHNQLCTTDL